MFLWSDSKIHISYFLIKTVNFTKGNKFSDLNKTIFELIRKVVKLYPAPVKEYSAEIINTCVSYIKSDASAREKELATETIHEMIASNVFDEKLIVEQLICDIMTVFSLKAPPARCKLLLSLASIHI